MRVLRQLRRDVIGFLDDQEHGICVLRGQREHLGYVYMILQELEETASDVFLCFPHAFASAEAYVSLIAERIEASGREAYGDPTWSIAARSDLPPAERLKMLLAGARGMLPGRSERPRIVGVLCPLTVEAEAEYVALVRGLLAPGVMLPPWFHRMRLFVHEPPGTRYELPPLVCELTVDMSPEALERGAREDAEDAAIAEPERVQAMLQVAITHVGHRRFAEAEAGFRDVHARAEALKSKPLAALAMIGLGDVARERRQPEEALAWYERALVPASETGSAIVLLIVTRHLAHLYFELQRYSEAEEFFDGAQKLAGVVPEPETQALALDWRGRTQELRGATADSAASYLAAARVARDNDRQDLLRDLRPRLAASQGQGVPIELRGQIGEFLAEGA